MVVLDVLLGVLLVLFCLCACFRECDLSRTRWVRLSTLDEVMIICVDCYRVRLFVYACALYYFMSSACVCVTLLVVAILVGCDPWCLLAVRDRSFCVGLGHVRGIRVSFLTAAGMFGCFDCHRGCERSRSRSGHTGMIFVVCILACSLMYSSCTVSCLLMLCISVLVAVICVLEGRVVGTARDAGKQ
ncbi:hypothetical protein I4F81_007843 [Pyropia yezoensis]|uniref:Uncharacterized protein n=1 Tax=Pyropia yezoensis TaxID=2788 RepID=A0ACC3C5Q4_PYRYE|nr:hypothetical protein I4F81_007843 [Neopyropia yezoensis]